MHRYINIYINNYTWIYIYICIYVFLFKFIPEQALQCVCMYGCMLSLSHFQRFFCVCCCYGLLKFWVVFSRTNSSTVFFPRTRCVLAVRCSLEGARNAYIYTLLGSMRYTLAHTHATRRGAWKRKTLPPETKPLHDQSPRCARLPSLPPCHVLSTLVFLTPPHYM